MASLSVASYANGQELIIDNEGAAANVAIPLKSNTLVTIDENSNVTVVPSETFEMQNADPLVSLFIDQLSQSDQVILSGKVIGEDSCNATSSLSQYNGWANNATLINENGFGNIALNSGSWNNDVRFSVNCGTDSAEVWYVHAEAAQVPNATVSNFSVVETSNNNYKIRFLPNNGAVQCRGAAGTAISGFSTTNITNGQFFETTQSYSIPQDASQSWFVQCKSSNNTYVSSSPVTVTYDEPIVIPSNCENVQTPTHSSLVNSTYSSHYGTPFPNNTSASPEIDIELGKYRAISFQYVKPTVSPGSDLAAFNFQAANGLYGEPIETTVTISECPGDFGGNNSVVPANCSTVLQVGAGQLRTYPTDSTYSGAQFFCQLEAGKQYYLNIVHTDQPYAEEPECNIVRNGGCAVLSAQGF